MPSLHVPVVAVPKGDPIQMKPNRQEDPQMLDPSDGSDGDRPPDRQRDPRRPPLRFFPAWVTQLWDLLQAEGAIEMAEEGPVLYLQSFYISHQHHPHQHISRPLRIDRDYVEWERDFRFVWEDFVDENAPMDIHLVRPELPLPVTRGVAATCCSHNILFHVRLLAWFLRCMMIFLQPEELNLHTLLDILHLRGIFSGMQGLSRPVKKSSNKAMGSALSKLVTLSLIRPDRCVWLMALALLFAFLPGSRTRNGKTSSSRDFVQILCRRCIFQKMTMQSISWHAPVPKCSQRIKRPVHPLPAEVGLPLLQTSPMWMRGRTGV